MPEAPTRRGARADLLELVEGVTSAVPNSIRLREPTVSQLRNTLRPVLVTLLLTSVPATAAPAQSIVVFDSERDGNREIYAMNADGSGQVNLSQTPASEVSPRWSPDGSMIAYVAGGNLWLMNPDGSGQTLLYDGPSSIVRPVWSADGETLFFSSGSSLFSIPSSGGTATMILNDDELNSRPSPTPDGLFLIFQRSVDEDREIHSLRLSDGEIQQLTDATNRSQAPLVSPDGTKIAFYSNRETTWSTWVMDIDGSNPTLARTATEPTAWSPDGKRIYANNYFAFNRVLVFDVDGDNLVELTDGSTEDMNAHSIPFLFGDSFESGDTPASQ